MNLMHGIIRAICMDSSWICAYALYYGIGMEA
jgi:hypothetical protein